MKHTYSIYTVTKPALRGHDVFSKFALRLLQMCIVCASRTLRRVNGVTRIQILPEFKGMWVMGCLHDPANVQQTSSCKKHPITSQQTDDQKQTKRETSPIS